MSLILVIDDEPDIVRFVRRALEADSHIVLTAPNGLDGLRLAIEASPDLVILDLAMPGLDGEIVLAAMMEQQPQQRVLVLSAVGDAETRVRCLEQGAVDFLGKPFALGELTSRVNSHLKETSGSARSVLSTGSLSLDLRRREVHFGKKVTELSGCEFLLLSHLMRHAGKVCTREVLLADVWGYDFDPGTNVVDVYVRRLRKKIPEDVIKTVDNVGYQLQSA
ncbi:MAG: response regulator transcription factor [Candidatus Nanopelagicales bacterium]